MVEYPIKNGAETGEQEAEQADNRSEANSLLVDAAEQLIRRKWLIALLTATAVAIGVVYSLLLPPEYTATTKIMPPQQTQSSASMLMSQLTGGGGGGAMGSLAAAATGGGISLHNPTDTYVGMLNSRPVADALIRQFDMGREYRTGEMSALRRQLAAHTSVKAEKSGFIAISVTDRDKKRAADLANAYTEQLRTLTRELAVTEASQRRLFYDEQLKRANADLVTAQATFQEIQHKKGVLFLDAQAKSLITGLAELRAQAATKEVQLQALRSYSTEKNPEVQLLENQVASLRGQSSQLEHSGHGAGSDDVGLQDVAGAGVDYLRAEHELQYRQIMFDLLLKQYDAARLDEAKEAAVIQVIEPAIEPDHRTSPHRSVIVMAFAFLGLFCGCAWALASVFLRINPGLAGLISDLKAVCLKKQVGMAGR